MKTIKMIAAAWQKCKRHYPPYKKTPEEPMIIVHIPHSSTNIPEMFQREFLPEKEKLHSELLSMIEVNRSLYMNEKTGEKKSSFDEVKDVICDFLRLAGKDFIAW